MVRISTSAFKTDDHINAVASCTVYFCYTCIKCGHKSDWIPLGLQLNKKSKCNHNETSSITSNDDLEYAKKSVYNELYNHIKKLESMPDTEERYPEIQYWTYIEEEKLKCPICNTFQSRDTLIKNKNVIGCFFMLIGIGCFAIVLFFLYHFFFGRLSFLADNVARNRVFAGIVILTGAFLGGIAIILGYMRLLIQGTIANIKRRIAKQKFAIWLFDDINKF